MNLLQSQKNILFDVISNNPHFANSQFKLSENEDATIIKYTKSNFYFQTSQAFMSTNFSVIISPGKNFIYEDYKTDGFENVMLFFDAWLSYLNREIKAPNKWKQLNIYLKQIDIKFIPTSPDLFSYEEFKDISNKINELRDQIITLNLGQSHLNIINSKLDLLIDYAKTSNKFDWQSFFIGTIVNLILQLGITQENSSAIWMYIKSIFSNLIQIK